jgi:NADP-dependent 3-hydroxy acid dehydrogenase YdfG
MDMKTVVISGGSDGLGKAIAQTLSGDFKVTILSPTSKKLKITANEIGVDSIKCDVRNYAQCEEAISYIQSKYRSIDILINNAGLWIEGALDKNDPKVIKNVLEVNGLGPIFLTKACLPFMKSQKSGLIININSQGGLYAKEERSVYGFTKWGLTGFSKSLQSELKKHGIKVTDVHPGKMRTKMFEKLGIQKNMSDSIEPMEVAKIIKVLISLPSQIYIPEIGIKNVLN